MVWIFIAMKNRYLNLSAVLKLATNQMNQNEPKRSNANPEPATAIYDLDHKQAGFDSFFIDGRGFIYLGISRMNFTF